MERHHYTFIVKISASPDRSPRGYVVDNANQERGYFEDLNRLEEFILARVNSSCRNAEFHATDVAGQSDANRKSKKEG